MEEFRRIKEEHPKALRMRAARVVLDGSVVRVFEKGTKAKLIPVLHGMQVDGLIELSDEGDFRRWFEGQLEMVASKIKECRSHSGYQWGHATKILNLYLRELVLNSRYFAEEAAKRIEPWLYTPIDRIAIENLRRLGISLPFKYIKDIDSRDKFFDLQRELGRAAEQAGVPRVWLDDNWATSR